MKRSELDEMIEIPRDEWGRNLSSFPLSARLSGILERNGILVLEHLHGLTYRWMAKLRNCGSGTLAELRQLVGSVQDGTPPPPLLVLPEKILIPPYAREIRVADLPVSVRLEHVLERKGIVRLGDLHQRTAREFRGVKNCGKLTLTELGKLLERIAAGEFQSGTEDFSKAAVVETVRLIDKGLLEQPPREREVFLLSFGGGGKDCWNYEEIGRRIKLTRERVRQLMDLTLSRIKRAGGPKMKNSLRGVAAECCRKVCPLTPALLEQWVGCPTAFRHPSVFYMRVFGEFEKSIPLWPDGRVLSSRPEYDQRLAARATALLRKELRPLHLSEVFARVSGQMGRAKPGVLDFVEALQRARWLEIDFAIPDQPTVRLRHLSAGEIAKAVLLSSKRPLTADEILGRAREQFGQSRVRCGAQSLRNALLDSKDFILLDVKTFGLRQYFRSRERLWRRIRNDVHSLLSSQNRPAATWEILANQSFDWTPRINKWELVSILRDDQRFVYLGRLHFGLASLGVTRREFIKDLVPKILSDAGRPLTGTEISKRLQHVRPVLPSSIRATLLAQPLVRDYGFGFFGLRSLEETAMEYLVTDTKFVRRAIRGLVRPLSFERLCESVGVPSTGQCAARLRQTCSSLGFADWNVGEQCSDPSLPLVQDSSILTHTAPPSDHASGR